MNAPLLQAARVVETISRLQERIDSRFPGSGLSRVCGALQQTAQSARERSEQLGRPFIAIRMLTWILVVLLIVAIGTAIASLGIRWRAMDVTELIQASEAGLNEAVLIGAGLYFLISLETRMKRGRALHAIQRLRNVAHVIDMHQLAKDPERLSGDYRPNESSPRQTMTAFELSRYLDYCTELLSLTGKVAAIYVQHFDDSIVLDAVGEIEELTTGLSQKIAQKIQLLHVTAPEPRRPSKDPRSTA